MRFSRLIDVDHAMRRKRHTGAPNDRPIDIYLAMRAKRRSHASGGGADRHFDRQESTLATLTRQAVNDPQLNRRVVVAPASTAAGEGTGTGRQRHTRVRFSRLIDVDHAMRRKRHTGAPNDRPIDIYLAMRAKRRSHASGGGADRHFDRQESTLATLTRQAVNDPQLNRRVVVAPASTAAGEGMATGRQRHTGVRSARLIDVDHAMRRKRHTGASLERLIDIYLATRAKCRSDASNDDAIDISIATIRPSPPSPAKP